MASRAEILDRIRKLREMTTDRGCTEAEAIAAAAKAAALMAKSGFVEGDVSFDEASDPIDIKGHSPRRKLWQAIAHCTNTAVIISDNGPTSHSLIFVGARPGPDIALYLRDVCDRAIKREITDFRKGTFYQRRRKPATRRQAVHDFTEGMVARLRIRLFELFNESIDQDQQQLAKRELDRRFPSSSSFAARAQRSRFDQARREGFGAGHRANLSHGVSGHRTAAFIGGES